jgi:predicted alpha/beta-hydrolase family hydrolase
VNFHAVSHPEPEPRRVAVGDEEVGARIYRAKDPFGTLILAHGAGADQRHRFLVAWAAGLAARGLDVVTFNFRYTEAGRKSPDKKDALEACYRAVVDAVGGFGLAKPIALGGKSMGGRIASQVVAAGVPASALVFLGYPLHPPNRPDQLRVAHWPRIQVPMLFVQGTRDPFGSPDELRPHLEGLRATVLPVDGGDHSFAVLRKLGVPQAELDERLRDQVAEWLRARNSPNALV